MENSENPGPSQSWLQRRLQPRRSRSLPYPRFFKIAFRTAHLMAISTLVGGHAFGGPVSTLKPVLYVAIVTGGGLIFLETYPSLHFLFELWWLMVLGKLILLCLIPFFWARRFPILLVVVAIASVGSHMPLRFRHYSLLYRKVIKV
jgi:hypothetical protein